ncbi:flap endonuclease-1 [Candidatus Woesearchaeota archaeon]|nr:flap endonuclease-1 [Candidatus Woesearchaeota archaeon]
MGVQITEILKRHEIRIEDVENKTVIVDAPNHLYQFLTTIRARDGSPFTDSKGRVTSHLIGLFSRSTNLMRHGIRQVYVFDGKPPELKHKEIEKRKSIKEEAEAEYTKALKKGDTELMKKYAGRFSRLTGDMIAEAKRLLEALGIPYVDAPSEAEAQAAHMAKKGIGYAVASQDADSLLFGAPRLLRNLSITGRRKKAGTLSYAAVHPELILLEENLKELGISQKQLIALCMLVGTDYNPGGIKGIGPKKALELVKRHKEDFNTMFKEAKWSETFEEDWEEVFNTFTNIPVTDKYAAKWSQPDKTQLIALLCGEHDFAEERVETTMTGLAKEQKNQKGLADFFK